MVETLLRGIGLHHHGVTFNFGSASMCSPAILEICFSYDKDIWTTTTDYYYVLLHNCAISTHSYTPINTFYSFVISLLINAVILRMNYLVSIVYLYIHFYTQFLFFLNVTFSS